MSQKRLIFAYRMKREFFSQMNYYNEFDKGAAAWLRELIKRGHIPYGYVDERSITDVRPSDLEGFTQCHFFAGIGGWSQALNLARIRPDQRLWTGSPPCQPFSVAGKQLGQLDDRHLAPTFMRLVEQCRPPVLFGEQVAAAIGKHWLDDLFTELERQGYACGSAVLPACSVGAPHKRDRLFFGAVNELANTKGDIHIRKISRSTGPEKEFQGEDWTKIPSSRDSCGANIAVSDRVANTYSEQRNRCGNIRSSRRDEPANCNHNSRMADTDNSGLERWTGVQERSIKQPSGPGSVDSRSADTHHSFWSDSDWLGCRDGKFRPVESGTFPLANGIPARMVRLRGFGNAIVPQVAAEFIKAFMESI